MKNLSILLSLTCILHSTRSIIVGKNVKSASEEARLRKTSLVNLLDRIIDLYFGNSSLAIIDASTEIRSFELRDFFDNQNVTIVHQRVDLSRKIERERNLQDKWYNYVIFIDNVFDISRLIECERRSKVLVVTSTLPWTVLDFLKSYISRFYNNLLIITHSASLRAQPGSYVLFTHNLYSNGIGSSEPVLLTSWIRDRFTRDVDLFPEKLLLGFQGHRLAISTAHTPPFAIRRSISGTDEVLWDGIDIRVMHLLAKILNFTIEFRDPESVENGPITSATKDVALGVASVGVGGIYKTRDVVSQFDTTVSHVEDCAAFISLASMALPKYRAVMGPFSVTVWILLICAYLLAILPFSLNTEYSLLSLITRPSTTNNMFWFVFSTFTNSFKVKDPLLKHGLGKNSTSLLIGIYWVFTIIITSCYTGSIIAFITVPIYPDAMETTKELLWYRYRIGTLDHDGWDARLAEIEDDPIAEKLLKNVEFVPSVTAGVRNASRAFFWPYAFLGSRTLFEYIVQANFTPNWFTKRSLMHISRECFSTYGTTFLLPHRSIYTESFNKMLARAQQTGIIQKIIRDVKWDIQRTATGKFLQVSKGPSFPFLLGEERQLTLDDTQGMFMIFGIGVLAGMILLIMEFIIRKIDKYCRRENIDDCQEIQDDDQPEYVNKFRMSMLRTSEDDVSMMWRFWKSRASV